MNLKSAAQTVYQLKFNPEVAAALHLKKAQIVSLHNGGIRAMAKDPHGKFISHGELYRLGQAAAVSAIAWQILSAVTAQHFLHTIDQRLQQLDDIRRFLDQQRIGRIQGAYEYLQVLSGALRCTKAIPDLTTWASQLESVQIHCSEQLSFSRMALADTLHELHKLNLNPKWFGNKREDAMKLVESHAKECEIFLASLYIVSLADRIRCGLPVDDSVSVARCSETRRRLGELRADLADVAYTIRAKLDPNRESSAGLIRSIRDFIGASPDGLGNEVNERLGRVAGILSSLEDDADAMEKMFDARRKFADGCVTVDVVLDHGQVSAFRLVGAREM
jgi:hypothetical protein